MTATTKPQAPMTQAPVSHRFTVEEYLAMAEHGILKGDARVELLAGEVVDMSPIGRRHNTCVNYLSNLLVRTLGGRVIVQTRGTLQLSKGFAPEPDLVLLRPRDDYYAADGPSVDDIFLIIEVADTSLHHDRTIKLRLYAEAGIAEYWIVDLNDRRIETYAAPDAAGTYARQRLVEPGQPLAPRAFPDLTLDTATLLRI